MRVAFLFAYLFGLAGVSLAESSSDTRREYKYQVDKDKISIDAEYKAKDKVADIDDESKLSWVIGVYGSGYQNVAKGFAKTTDTKSNFEMDHRIEEVVEYLPENPDLDEPYNGETAVRVWKLDKWKDTVRQGTDSEPNVITFETEDGMFKAIARVNTGAFSAAGGALAVGMDDIKVDFDVNFPVSDDRHRLALLGRLVTKAKTKIKKSTETESDVTNGVDLTDESTGAGGHFDWVTDVECDNQGTKTKRKIWSKFEDDGSDDHKMSFTLMKERTDGNCVWDPVYGVNLPAFSAAPSLRLPALALAIPFAALWLY